MAAIAADVRDIDDGSQVRVNIWEKDQVGSDDFITSMKVYVKSGKVERTWKVEYHEDTDDVDSEQEQQEKGYTMPEYVYKLDTTSGPEVVSGESPVLEVYGWLKVKLIDSRTGKILSNYKYIIHLPDGTTKEGTTDNDGYIDNKELPVTNTYYISLNE